LNPEIEQRVRQIIAEVVGFETEDIADEDSFIADYRISYPERKTLLDRLNQEFSREVAFDAFVKMDKVSDVIVAFQA
jgi:acyl carrier protein